MAASTEVAAKATFDTDDKRAQYARLVAFNFAVKDKMVKKGDADVNSVSNTVLTKAVDALADGNILAGKEGIELIQEMSKAGATDENVAKRGLTTAYAQEVRPFIRRKTLAPSFGRRAKPKAEKTDEQKKAEADAKAKKAGAKKSGGKKAPAKKESTPATA